MQIPDHTCQPYISLDIPQDPDCSKPDERVCKDCTWPPPAEGSEGKCWAKTKFDRYKVKEFGVIHGAKALKKEIFARGPICKQKNWQASIAACCHLACGLEVTSKFLAYSGGIFSEKNDIPQINHEISLVGFGKDENSGEEFWVGRNSWGTYWGEEGFFR